jgi:DNA-binding NtrC family response regulator
MSVHSDQRARDASVLVVDDQREIRELATLVLQDAGYIVHCAEHGAAALEAVKKEPHSVILLDMHACDGRLGVRSTLPFEPECASSPGGDDRGA